MTEHKHTRVCYAVGCPQIRADALEATANATSGPRSDREATARVLGPSGRQRATQGENDGDGADHTTEGRE